MIEPDATPTTADRLNRRLRSHQNNFHRLNGLSLTFTGAVYIHIHATQ